MRGLSAKNVIVTGGGGAIGGAICRRFAGYGASIGVFDKNLDGANKVADEIRKDGGKAFVSGADISKFESERSNEEEQARYNAVVAKANDALYHFPKPTIAMIRGYCIGGGLGLAVCCDLRICSDNSKFAIPAAKLGLGYGFGGIKRLSDLVGPSFAKEIFFTARQFDAVEAQTMGLVNRVLPGDKLESYVKDYADTIGGNAPLTVNSVKFIANQTVADEDKRDLKRCADLVKRCFDSKDFIEGRRAFMEKRKPAFVGG